MKYITILISLVTFSLLTSLAPGKKSDAILKHLKDVNSGYVMVAAHRAGHNGHPENSLSAWQHAIETGVDIIETDVKVTKDSVVVLMHDGKINRTTNGTGNPEDYTLAELKKFRLKMPDGTVTDESIPTFEDALKLARGKILIDIDIKTSHLKPVADVVRKMNCQSQVLYFDNDYNALRKVLSMESGAMMMPRAYSYQMADSALKIFSANVVHIDDSFYTRELTDLIRSKGSRVWINALGGPDDKIRAGKIEQAVSELLKYRANIIQTDEPEKLIPYLESAGKRD
jgi:glycerophosphoryl diester phosphodiesterase